MTSITTAHSHDATHRFEEKIDILATMEWDQGAEAPDGAVGRGGCYIMPNGRVIGVNRCGHYEVGMVAIQTASTQGGWHGRELEGLSQIYLQDLGAIRVSYECGLHPVVQFTEAVTAEALDALRGCLSALRERSERLTVEAHLPKVSEVPEIWRRDAREITRADAPCLRVYAEHDHTWTRAACRALLKALREHAHQ
jgi:hypothetical protein